MRLRNRTVEAGVCASHDALNANMVMLNTWRATHDPAFQGDGEAEDLASYIDHVNLAWASATRHYLTAGDAGAPFDAWRMTVRDVISLTAEGHELATIPPSDTTGRVYAVGIMKSHGLGWMGKVATSSPSFDDLIVAEGHLWSVFASAESAHT